MRSDRSADDLTAWLLVLLDGFASQLAGNAAYTVETQATLLQDSATRLLAP